MKNKKIYAAISFMTLFCLSTQAIADEYIDSINGCKIILPSISSTETSNMPHNEPI